MTLTAAQTARSSRVERPGIDARLLDLRIHDESRTNTTLFPSADQIVS